MSNPWMRPIKLTLLAILVTAGVLASASFGTRAVDAQVGPIVCPVGFVSTDFGCVPVAALGGCPVGFVLTSAGCLPSQTVNTCAAGFALTAIGCVSTTSTLPVAGSANLLPGCDELVLPTGFGANTPATTLVAMVQPGGIVTSVWQFSNSLHIFIALYFGTVGAPTDATTAGASQSVFICVSVGGTFVPQGASTTSCADGFVATPGGCLPVSGSCTAGFFFAPALGGCVPMSGTSACPAGFVAIVSLGGCVPLSTVGGCPVGFFFNPVTGTCSFSE
jgi:hypothetical protein